MYNVHYPTSAFNKDHKTSKRDEELFHNFYSRPKKIKNIKLLRRAFHRKVLHKEICKIYKSEKVIQFEN